MNRHARRAAAAKAAKNPSSTDSQAVEVMQKAMERAGLVGELRGMIEGFEGFSGELSAKVDELLAENSRLMEESQAQQEITIRFVAEVTGHSFEYLRDTWELVRAKYEKEQANGKEAG